MNFGNEDYMKDPENKKLIMMSIASPNSKYKPTTASMPKAVQRRIMAKKLISDRREKLRKLLSDEDAY